jgi:hypothetical protein
MDSVASSINKFDFGTKYGSPLPTGHPQPLPASRSPGQRRRATKLHGHAPGSVDALRHLPETLMLAAPCVLRVETLWRRPNAARSCRHHDGHGAHSLLWTARSSPSLFTDGTKPTELNTGSTHHPREHLFTGALTASSYARWGKVICDESANAPSRSMVAVGAMVDETAQHPGSWS